MKPGTRRYLIRVHAAGKGWTCSRLGVSAEDAVAKLRREYPDADVKRVTPMFQKGDSK